MDARDFFGYKHADEEPGRRPDADDGTEADRAPLFEEAVTLDDAATLKRIDPDDMLGKVAAMPGQLIQSRRVAAAVPLDDRLKAVDAVIVLAMGGSAIGAELVAAAAGERLRVPLVVHRDYGLPAWVGAGDVVMAASCSGTTEETGGETGDAVEIVDFNYKPADLKVKVGTTVTFTNADGFAHTVTAKDKSFDSGSMEEGATFEYLCAIHNSMMGTVTVS